MFIVSKALLITSATIIVRTNVCSAVTVECFVLYPCCVGVFGMFAVMLVLRAVFNMLVRKASPRGPMCFRYMIFSLSGPWEFLFLLCFISYWT